MTGVPLEIASRFPQTRYLGSKRKLLPFLHETFSTLEFDTVLDPFCGTGSVAYLLKCMGKQVTASDALESAATAGRALIENRSVRLDGEIETLLADLPDPGHPAGFVESTFDGLFFLREENRFIDQILPRISALPDSTKRDLARWSLMQACLAKRPYNLFHRANLAMRTRDVTRSFGNKATWDTPFPDLMRRFARAADDAVFDSPVPCTAQRSSALEMDPAGFDLVYLDPPYMSAGGTGVDYLDYYHFLEGLCDPASWGSRILNRYRHLPLRGRGENPWNNPTGITEAFERTIAHFSTATMVISYRSDGIPTVHALGAMLKRAGKRVHVVESPTYTYALSTNRTSKEVLIIGR